MTPAAKFSRDMAKLVADELQSCLSANDGDRMARATITAGTALAVIIAASMGGDRKGMTETLGEMIKHVRMKLDQLSTEFGK